MASQTGTITHPISNTEMMKQTSFADVEFASKKKLTRRERFLSEIDAATPWPVLVAALLPHYPKADGRGRPPIGLERMLRMYIAQQCLGLSDEGIEDAIYDIGSVRNFVGVDLTHESAPDATTLLKFRRLLETHKLGEVLFAKVGEVLQAHGLKVGTGTIVDATIIGAPSSTKNADKARDPEMHQTRKGQQWYFGMKLHIGVDSHWGVAHSAVVTAANVHDKHPLPELLHGSERRVYGDSAYASQKVLIQTKAAQARDFTSQRVRKGGEIDEAERSRNRNKSKVRARVEHVFAVVKRLWGFNKVRYRGLAKNATRSFVALGLANIYLARRRLA